MANNEIMSIDKLSATIASQATKWISDDIQDGKIPEIPGYNTGSEIIGAMMKIAQVKDRTGRNALSVCTRESVLSSMRDMVVQGLSMVRSQCYPIVYGDKLVIQRSYFGTICAFNRMFPTLKVVANVLHQDDKYIKHRDEMFEFDYIEVVEAPIENQDKPIVAAYASIIDMTTRQRVYGTVMTMKEIRTSWSHAKTQNVHNEFPQEMAKRTVINRMLKMYVNTSTTAVDPMIADAYMRTTKNEFEDDDAFATAPDTDTAEMIRSKSKGAKGLDAILQSKKANEVRVATVTEEPALPETHEETPASAPETNDGETTPPANNEAPESDFFDADSGEIMNDGDIPF